LFLADDRSLNCLFVLRISDLYSFCVFYAALDDLVIYGLVDVGPRSSYTTLPTVSEEDAGLLNSKIDVSISTDDVG